MPKQSKKTSNILASILQFNKFFFGFLPTPSPIYSSSITEHSMAINGRTFRAELFLFFRIKCRVFMAGSTAKPCMVCVTQRGVIVHSYIRPGTHGGRLCPTQIMHSPAPSLLFDPFFSTNASHSISFMLKGSAIAKGVVTRMEPDFMPSPMNPSKQIPHH